MAAKPMYTSKDVRRAKPVQSDAWRSDYRRDYARLLHSSAFRRLQGKTQLLPGHESDFFRNRLTHSLEVAQIAKSIAQKINYDLIKSRTSASVRIDEDLIEFACLAHDLGHPPFGHNGEAALDECMMQFGGFEGNAQTLRIVSTLEKKETQRDEIGSRYQGRENRIGLNLTYRSLASVLKYDNCIPKARSEVGLVKGYYEEDEELVKKIKSAVAGSSEPRTFKTIECAIMDLADDIAYSTYDLEDIFKANFETPLSIVSAIASNDELRSRCFERVKRAVLSATDMRYEISEDDFLEVLLDEFYANGSSADSQHTEDIEADEKAILAYQISKNTVANGYWRTGYTSDLVNRAMNGVEFKLVKDSPAFSVVSLKDETLLRVETLKQVAFQLVISSRKLRVVEYRGKRLVKELFGMLAEEPDGPRLLPHDYRDVYYACPDKQSKMRTICDFVCGMTDRYAVEFYSRLRTDAQSISSIYKPF
jgi:dGTPase